MSSAAQLRPAVFLDRDGVLNIDHGYVHRPEQLEWVEGAPAAVARFNRAGLLVLVVTNQAGVARGYYEEPQVHVFHAHLNAELARFGARIDAFYHCPFHADAVVEAWRHPNHPDRKPNPGMILRAIREWRVDAARSFLIGDQETDMQAAKAAGISGHRFEGGSLDALAARILSGPNTL